MKVILSSFLRNLGLLFFFDKIRYYCLFINTLKSRKHFKQRNPDIILPPDYLLYESYRLNYDKYYYTGKETASWLINLIREYKELKNVSILDWGCGPARIVTHLPKILDDSCNIYGTDYNKQTIEWCRNNIKNVQFYENGIEAKLDFTNDFFDVIYGISIFTHLSEENHYNWFNELLRVTKKGGILLLTTHGKSTLGLLNNAEQESFNNGNIVIKGNTKEGHRTYAAFHPYNFFKNLIWNNKILSYTEGKVGEQDIWIIEKT